MAAIVKFRRRSRLKLAWDGIVFFVIFFTAGCGAGFVMTRAVDWFLGIAQ